MSEHVPMPEDKQKIFLEILEERNRQDAKWGGTAHDDQHDADDWFDYVRYQMSQVEEEWDGEDDNVVRRAYVKIAALAVAAVESFDRRLAADLDPVNGGFNQLLKR